MTLDRYDHLILDVLQAEGRLAGLAVDDPRMARLRGPTLTSCGRGMIASPP